MNNQYQYQNATITHDISDPNELPFVKLLKTGKSNGKTIQEMFNTHNKWDLDFAEECSVLFEHVLSNYDFAVTNKFARSLLDCPAESLISCFLNATKQGLSLKNPHPGYYLKCVENYGGANLCSTSYTARGLTQLLGALGVAKAIHTDVIFENDEWAVMGSAKKVEHKITTFDVVARGNVACAYATAIFEDDSCLTVHVTANELKASQDAAKEFSLNSGIQSIWETAYVNEMRKTKPIYRLWKELQPQIIRLRKNGLIDKTEFEMAKSVVASVEYDSQLNNENLSQKLN